LLEEELAILEEIYPKIKKYLSKAVSKRSKRMDLILLMMKANSVHQ
jgi:hypothetical protein